jgi:hypothetical protein
MYEELNAAIFSGVAVMVLTIPINTVVAKVSRKYQVPGSLHFFFVVENQE